MLPHLITLSALTGTFGGTVRPICFAVFRLNTSSNFVGCSTGKSAGLVPLSILSTNRAARRSKSAVLNAVAHKPSGFHNFRSVVYHWQTALYREVRNLCSVSIH